MLDGLQRSINHLLQDRERLVLDLRTVAEAIRIEGPEGLQGIFGGDKRVEQFFELAALAEAPLYRSQFHRDFPADDGFSYDPTTSGPVGYSARRSATSRTIGVPPLHFPEIDVSGDVSGLTAAAGPIEQESSAKVVISGAEPVDLPSL